VSEFEINLAARDSLDGVTAVFVDVHQSGASLRWHAQFNFGPKTEIKEEAIKANAYLLNSGGMMVIQILRQGSAVIAEQIVAGQDTRTSPLPWTIKGSWEQLDPGHWITDADGKVIYADGCDPWEPDVALSDKDRAVLEQILWMDREPR
jgi:hypothetical protein